MTQSVGVDELGGLWTKVGGGIQQCELLIDVTTTERVSVVSQSIDDVAYDMIIAVCENIAGHADNGTNQHTLMLDVMNSKKENFRLKGLGSVTTSTTVGFGKGYRHLTPKVAFGEAYSNVHELNGNSLGPSRSGISMQPWEGNTLTHIQFFSGQNTMEVGARLRAWGVKL
jgi:hypothetical protein